jgi:CO/xanthine dehydrogenase Mo-binding subunit
VIIGLAVQLACRDIQAQVCAMAAQVMGGEASAYALVEGGVLASGTLTSFRELLRQFQGVDSGEFLGVGRVSPNTNNGDFARSPLFWETAAGVFEINLDVETGEIRLRRVVSAADVGRVMNRLSAEGQDEGAIIQGLGHALSEEYVYEDGQLINGTLFDYHVPTLDESPERCVTLLLESGDGPGPDGARGMGEGAILPVAPAIANALAQGYGIRIRDLPMTPEKVWRALRDQAKSA